MKGNRKEKEVVIRKREIVIKKGIKNSEIKGNKIKTTAYTGYLCVLINMVV